jgi:streptogramin lyase
MWMLPFGLIWRPCLSRKSFNRRSVHSRTAYRSGRVRSLLQLQRLEDRVVPTGPTINEFPITAGSTPANIAAGPDGNLWFTEESANQIGTINPSTHAVSEFAVSTVGGAPLGITAGPDGNLWFTEESAKIGTINPSTHLITEFPFPTAGSSPDAITTGPDGNLWFTEFFGNKIGQINPSTHVISEFPAAGTPGGITVGPDGNLWFTEADGNAIGQINPSTHVISEFALPTAFARPLDIAVGADGNLWFTEYFGKKIGQINLSTHAISEFAVLTAGVGPVHITAGPDGNLWFPLADGIGQINPSTHVINEFALPRANRNGITAGPDGNLWFGEDDVLSNQTPSYIGEVVLAPPAVVTYVTSLYQTVLNRTPALTEVNSWVQFLQSGGTRSQVAQTFWESAEHRGIQVDGFYQTYLHRTESTAERAGWVSAFFLSGMNEIQIEHAFLASPEYQAAHQSDSALIDGLYHDVLGRQESQSELAAWLNLLSSGLTRDQAEVGFLTSWENDIRIVDNYYSTLLGRPADPGGETAWTNLLLSGSNTRDEIAEAFLASDEFFARALTL